MGRAGMTPWRNPPAKPRRLRAGDRVAVVSPSWGGPGAFPARYSAGKRALEARLALEVVEMPHALADPDWLARNPRARADDLVAAFCDPDVHAIVASIGGDDAVRLIPYLDLEAIAAHPKVFLGYSDTTALHLACLKAGLGSFYGPTVMAGFAENGAPFAFVLDSLRRTLFAADAVGTIAPNDGGWTAEFSDWGDPANQAIPRALRPSTGPRTLQGRGVARGRLLGGCAEVLEMVKGSPWWPPLEVWRGAILFYETSEEAPNPALVTRWLRNFAAQGILNVLSAIIVGRPGGDVDPAQHAAYDAAIVHALDEANLLDLPVVAGLDFGHTDPFFTIPYGVEAEVDCHDASLTILEPAVS